MPQLKPAMPMDRLVRDALAASPRPTDLTLRATWTVDEATAYLRAQPVAPDQHVLYFYVLAQSPQTPDRLVGVIPARRLLLSPGSATLHEIMDRSLITLRATDTLFDACELFAMHRLLAIPVVDAAGAFLGTLDVSVYTDEVFDLAQRRSSDEMFQLIGLHLDQLRHASVVSGYRQRMPWLLTNIAGGLSCALLASLFEIALQRVVLLALFIPIMLTLCESIAMQSMTLTLQRLAGGMKARHSFLIGLPRELLTALGLGLTSGVLVMLLAYAWQPPVAIAPVIGLAIACDMLLAATIGHLIPVLVARLKLNPSVASGPVTLALTDIGAITIYLSAATWALGGAG